MEIKVLFRNYWVRLFLALLVGLFFYYLLVIILIKIGPGLNDPWVGIISAEIVGVVFFMVNWAGMHYDKGPLKFLW